MNVYAFKIDMPEYYLYSVMHFSIVIHLTVVMSRR